MNAAKSAAAIALCLASGAACAGAITTPVETGGSFSVPVTSLREARFKQTVRQQYDFSCGSAAIATLLTHHYRRPTDEAAVFDDMLRHGDAARIRREGFSLLDMKNFLARQGFEAEGYVVGLDALTQFGVPAIALIKESGYHHFVVIKGLRDGRVLVGDPASGTRAMPRALFEQRWVNRVLFVVRDRTQTARFNASDEWARAPAAPLGAAWQGAPDAMLIRRGPSDY